MRPDIPRLLIGAIAIAALGGCARSLVYDESRDKQGQEAKQAASSLKIVDSVRALEKGYADVAKLELESAKSLADTLRNKELARVARAKALRENEALRPDSTEPPFDGLLNVVEDRLTELGARRLAAGTVADKAAPRDCGALDCAALRMIQATPVLVRERREAFELSRAEFRALFGHDFKTCSDVRAAADEKNPDVVKDAFAKKFAAAAQRTGATASGYYADLLKKCDAVAAMEKRLVDVLQGDDPSSVLGVRAVAEGVEKDVAAYRVRLVVAQGELAEQVRLYAENERKAGENRLKDVEKRAEDLAKIVSNIRKGLDAAGKENIFGSAGSHAAAIELATKLETVLSAITGQQTAADKLDANDRAAVALVRAIPELVADADKLLKEAGKARLVPFAIAREHFRLEVKGFEDEIAIKVRRMEAQRARADAMTLELYALARVHFLLTQDKAAWASQPLSALVSTNDVKDKQRVYEALAIYWDEVFLQRSEEQIWKARAGALRYDEGLARSTAAALQWDNLIGGVGTVLADYHAAGVKPAEIAEFLKAIGVFYVGYRVGR